METRLLRTGDPPTWDEIQSWRGMLGQLSPDGLRCVAVWSEPVGVGRWAVRADYERVN